MSQNGAPAGLNVKLNADGRVKSHDTAFAIQCISRFALPYLLTTQGGFAPNAIVMSICNQGQSLDDLTVDDLSLKARLAAGPSAPTLFMQQSKRDSTVLDSCFEELNTRFPQYRYFSLWPGLVKTEKFDPNFAPGYIKWFMWLGIRLIGTTPDEYANYPVYILAAPDAPAHARIGKAPLF
ncbi:NAD(P)-binding protein [Mycena venus]|uniref:NAD(P)-binding protein n=1 Tax=Mycena venus TaxID=2733690 RepID=A0A8H6XIL7_9AGAR|nr:NAD(P)-binding protein [Mycena venus]